MEPAASRRTEILDAALACFAARGIAGSTIAEIRGRAGATTGSVYHFFDGKDAIVGALYLEILGDYQADLAASLRPHTSARAFVRGIVEQYLTWVERRPAAARFLLDARRTDAVAAAERAIADANAASIAAVRAQMKPWIAAGEIRRLPTDLFVALLVGPAEAFAHKWLAKQTAIELGRARSVLATAAWESVRGDDRT